MNYTEHETHRAAKPHRCTWCGQPSEHGSMYLRWRCFDYREASTSRLHPECYGAMLDAADGGEIEWGEGAEERPAAQDALRAGGVLP